MASLTNDALSKTVADNKTKLSAGLFIHSIYVHQRGIQSFMAQIKFQESSLHLRNAIVQYF